jgi:hypothetical protein
MITIRVRNATPELMQKLQAGVSRFIRKGAHYVEGELKSSMAESKSGKTYKRGKDGTHVASAPGESPAVDSSNYINDLKPVFENSLEARIGTVLDYPVLLEEGTPGGKIAPRPLWNKTLTEVLPTLETLLEAELPG